MTVLRRFDCVLTSTKAKVLAEHERSKFEADARLTAIWLWTLNSSKSEATDVDAEDNDLDEESETVAKKTKVSGFMLEYDAARKLLRDWVRSWKRWTL